MIHSQGGKISNETAAEHTSITGRSGDACWERKQRKDRKHIQEQHVSWFYQWEFCTGLHFVPIPPRGEVPYHATDNSTKLSTQALRILGKQAMHTHWCGANGQTGSIFCHHVSRPFACNWSGSHKGRWWRRHQNPDQRKNIYHTRFMKKNIEGKLDPLTHLSTTLSSPTLDARSSDSWWVGPSGELLVG